MKTNKFKQAVINIKLYEDEINDLKILAYEKKMSINEYLIKMIITRIIHEKWHKEQTELTKLNNTLNF
jgi:hypothetical protein